MLSRSRCTVEPVRLSFTLGVGTLPAATALSVSWTSLWGLCQSSVFMVLYTILNYLCLFILIVCMVFISVNSLLGVLGKGEALKGAITSIVLGLPRF